MLFQNLSPASSLVTEQAIELLALQAQKLGFLEPHASPWSIAELRLNESDWEWLQQWAHHLSANEARQWTSLHHEDFVTIGDKTLSTITAFGLLLLAFCAHSVRREGTEEQFWPAVRADSHDTPRFSRCHDVFWNEWGGRRGCVARAIKRAAYAWNLRHCFRGEDEQEYIGTIRLQFGFTLAGAKRLPYWLCGYGWPAPVRDLVSGRSVASASFGGFWNDLHDLRDGKIAPEAWRAQNIASPWILPEWADEISRNARAQSSLRKIGNTRTGAQNGRISEALAAIWDAQNPLSPAEFLGEPTLKLEGYDPVFRVAALDFRAPADAPYLNSGSLQLVAGNELIGSWIRQGKSRAFVPTAREFELPFVKPQLVAYLTAGEQTPVAKQTLQLWDDEDGFGWWNLQTGRPCDVWTTIPRPETPYALLVDGDLTVQPLPTQWSQIEDRNFLLPDSAWFQNAQILEDGAHFWKPPVHQEISWAKDFAMHIIAPPGGLRLGRMWQVEMQPPDEIRVNGVRWGGRLLIQETSNTWRATPFTTETIASFVTLEADLENEAGEKTTVTRRLAVPLSAVLWRDAKTQSRTSDEVMPWQIASGHEIWNAGEEREWKIWGQWSPDARVCEGDKPISTIPQRPRALRNTRKIGESLSVREAPFDEEKILVRIAKSTRDSGVLRGVTRKAAREIHLQFNYPLEPDVAHQVVVWGHRGALSVTPGEQVIPTGKKWMVPFKFSHETTPVLAVGLAYEGSWLGAHFVEQWRDLCPKGWESDRAFRFALLARWMRLPWREDSSVIFQLAHQWPVETLFAWLGKMPNPWGLRFSDDGRDWVRAVFRGSWNGDPQKAQQLRQKLDMTPAQLLQMLGETDPFLMLAVARDLANGNPGFAGLFQHIVNQINVSSRHRDRAPHGEIARLKGWLRERLHGVELDSNDEHSLRLALDDVVLRQFAATFLLEILAAQL